jgi:hypothetical protein
MEVFIVGALSPSGSTIPSLMVRLGLLSIPVNRTYLEVSVSADSPGKTRPLGRVLIQWAMSLSKVESWHKHRGRQCEGTGPDVTDHPRPPPEVGRGPGEGADSPREPVNKGAVHALTSDFQAQNCARVDFSC